MNIKIADLEFEPLITAEEIQNRIKEIAAELNADYKDKTPIIVGVLNGCFMFMADLVRHVNVPCETAFTKLSSYHGGTTSSRKISHDVELMVDIANRHVIVVEDIVDTGNTLDYFVDRLKERKPASVTVVALLLKPEAVEYSVEELQHVAFQIPNEFVVGYGLDYMELGRNLDGIYKRVV
ncbi:hypoxanthine phosphoribosyltransferase [Mucilaginibacter corticis]|uniref:Hypoxanthine phosphoribosyltransferase n=1 Tax=Mucilaginibacter corticis TaxID=2597670 RepID=A0A556MUC8_9SPHI|nr:hypoxanthine phosphoribosyltransferase [Mucilaginibacter corticis]TSJ43497.1 hypoxanthine phosphoribosyltransferase [Mucilaginibacter corticis]